MYFAIRYDTKQTYDLIKSMESAWDDVYGDYELEFFFLDEDFDRQYREENQLAKVLSIFAVIILIVSSIGLFGLISFVVLSRTKEVGIRKTMVQALVKSSSFFPKNLCFWYCWATCL